MFNSHKILSVAYVPEATPAPSAPVLYPVAYPVVPDPSKAEPCFSAGCDLYDANDYPGALVKFKEAQDHNPSDHRYDFNIAMCHKKSGDLRAALEHFTFAIVHYREQQTLNPRDERIRRTLGKSYLEQGSLYYQSGIRNAATSSELSKWYFEQAKISFSNAFEFNTPGADVNYGLALYKLGDYRAASAVFIGLIGKAPREPRNHIYCADVFRAWAQHTEMPKKLEHLIAAQRNLRSASDLDRTSPEIHFRIAIVCRSMVDIYQPIASARHASRAEKQSFTAAVTETNAAYTNALKFARETSSPLLARIEGSYESFPHKTR
jgi:tetratricopeptide (TPR) repeat protein